MSTAHTLLLKDEALMLETWNTWVCTFVEYESQAKSNACFTFYIYLKRKKYCKQKIFIFIDNISQKLPETKKTYHRQLKMRRCFRTMVTMCTCCPKEKVTWSGNALWFRFPILDLSFSWSLHIVLWYLECQNWNVSTYCVTDLHNEACDWDNCQK